jgi:hypothetical protein
VLREWLSWRWQCGWCWRCRCGCRGRWTSGWLQAGAVAVGASMASLSPDSHLKVGEHQYPDHALGAPLKSLKTVSTIATSTTTPPCAPPPLCSRGARTATATITALRNVLTSSHKRSTMHRASRQLLSRYLQSLKRACPPLANIQSARSSLYHRGQGNLGPN